MPRASSEARKSAARATSSSESRNLRHWPSRNARSFSGVRHNALWRLVTIAPGSVDQHGQRSERRIGVRDRRLKRFDIADVAMHIAHALGAEMLDERLRRGVGDVDERDAAFLRGERRDERGADAGAAARNENTAPREIRVACALTYAVRQCLVLPRTSIS